MRNKPMIDSSTRALRNKKDRNSDSRDHIDNLLDEALKESFPASDPVAVLIPEPEIPAE